MTTTDNPTSTDRVIDEQRLMDFVYRAVDEVGSTLNTALVVMGDQLGYYRALADAGPTTPAQLAERTGTSLRYAREWLAAQAAGHFVTYDPATGSYELPPEHAVALADQDSPAFLPGFFQLAYGTVRDAAQVIEAARTGAGVGWHEHNHDVHTGCERFFRPGYLANLVPAWLPALTGAVETLERGATVADIGCGHGASTILMAQAYPRSRFVGSDYHPESIQTARARAGAAGVTDRVEFVVADAASHPGAGYDLVTMFDSLHDMGDPLGVVRQVRNLIAPGGSWMLVEPLARDQVQDNLNPVGRAYYAFSTLLCTPNSLSQPVGLALGAQAGPARIQQLTEAAGFTQFRQAAETPFNMVFEVRR